MGDPQWGRGTPEGLWPVEEQCWSRNTDQLKGEEENPLRNEKQQRSPDELTSTSSVASGEELGRFGSWKQGKPRLGSRRKGVL